MIPARFAPVLFGFILSGVMCLLVSAIATLRAFGVGEGAVELWMGAWIFSWIVAFPAVLIVGPATRRLVAWMVR
jgi:hypothetical protein